MCAAHSLECGRSTSETLYNSTSCLAIFRRVKHYARAVMLNHEAYQKYIHLCAVEIYVERESDAAIKWKIEKLRK